ncbi:hypothetical protein Pyrfu_1843 [Pyrolobus fumarii 1A]|uniref:Uncharacterized protein n=1 Tax=Pyrolobus fumarii (strain DSM 11204 / 1A) TaxID=694429 RepID=G0ECX6_PYRF1|nr:hypothetical protein [Pyrolobus fumarii]AEM39696.1 hypothetical protein Pyrfu_1843 [Pyrolobus fumarii 1A]
MAAVGKGTVVIVNYSEPRLGHLILGIGQLCDAACYAVVLFLYRFHVNGGFAVPVTWGCEELRRREALGRAYEEG